jgi:type I restriction enzyme S subunit
MELRNGYKQTEVGVIPRDWNMETIGDLYDFQGGSQPPRYTFIFQEKPGYIRLLQIRDYKSDNFASYIPISLAKRFCSKEDIMIGRYGPPIFQILKGMEGSYNVALIKAVPNEKITKLYGWYILKQGKLFDFIEKLSQRSSGQTGVDLAELRKYLVPLPPIPEQTAIATALSNIDDLIISLKKIVEKKKNIKQGVMQQLLKPKNDWTETTLGEILDVISDYTANGSFESLKSMVTYYNETNYAVLVRTTDLGKDVFVPQRFTDKKGYKYLSKTSLFGGEIVIANVGSLGKVFRVPKFDSPMTLAPNTYLLKFKDSICEDFIFQWLSTKEFYSKLLSKIGSSTLQAINKDSLRSIVLSIPNNIKEQIELAAILIDMDNEILSLENRLAKIKLIKQGMMQNLLTGKIRLV